MTLYIGSYTKNPEAGLSATQFNTETGELSSPVTAAATPNPSFLALSPDGRLLLVSNESGKVAGGNTGGISVFTIGPRHELALHSAAALPAGPCHISVDSTGRYILTASYGSGTIDAHATPEPGLAAPVGTGRTGNLRRLDSVQHHGSGADPERQEKPHAHQILLSPDNRFVLAVDLGIDKVMVYRIGDGGKFIPHESGHVSLPPGSGPRHLAFHPNGRFFYVAGELDNTVSIFQYQPASGTADYVQSVSTLPAGYTGTSHLAEIAVHPNGCFLYVSNRGHDSIARFGIKTDCSLEALSHTATGGRSPRHFSFDPTGHWLLTANADSASITVFRMDSENGELEKKHQLSGIDGQPVCLLFAPSV